MIKADISSFKIYQISLTKIILLHNSFSLDYFKRLFDNCASSPNDSEKINYWKTERLRAKRTIWDKILKGQFKSLHCFFLSFLQR